MLESLPQTGRLFFLCVILRPLFRVVNECANHNFWTLVYTDLH